MVLRALPRLPPLFVDDRRAADLARLRSQASAATGSSGTNWRSCRPPRPPSCSTGCRSSANRQRATSSAPDSISDRFFTMLVFIHIGVPLLLILGLWAHVHRISHVDYLPSRRVMLATLAALIVLALLKPALSNPPANLATCSRRTRLRLVHPVHPSADRPHFAGDRLVAALRRHRAALRPAICCLTPPRSRWRSSTPANCTGCDRCLADCPYAAIAMQPHPLRPGLKLAVVDADLCAGCGICARLLPVVDALPPTRDSRHRHRHAPATSQCAARATRGSSGTTHRPHPHCRLLLRRWRQRQNAGRRRHRRDRPSAHWPCCLRPSSNTRCAPGPTASSLLPAAAGGCAFRLGEQWTQQRLLGEREPHLRRTVPPSRLQVASRLGARRRQAGRSDWPTSEAASTRSRRRATDFPPIGVALSHHA
jgi:ferredoxin